ncbi:MAG: NAD(P)/FAD-dependent oxidoreductase [Planctomycetota bacterium]|jgi:flavin-dependent dehydrogenase
MIHDLLIAGGGPAGLATAIAGAQRGLSCVVVEPRRGALDKACGEGVQPGGVRALERMGLTFPEARPFVGIRYLDAVTGVSAEGDLRSPGLGIRRLHLHETMLRRADALGVTRVVGKVTGFLHDPDFVEALGIRARFLVAADGLGSPIRRLIGAERRGRDHARGRARYGLRRHFRVSPWTDYVEVYWTRRAEAYVTPVGGGVVGVAVLTEQPNIPYDEWLEQFPALLERLRGVEPASEVRGAGPFNRWAERVVRGRVLFVGDAAGFLDPITGEGIRLATLSAEALSASIAEGRPGLYQERWTALVRRYWCSTSALLWVRRRSLLRPRLVPFLRRIPWVFDASLRWLEG